MNKTNSTDWYQNNKTYMQTVKMKKPKLKDAKTYKLIAILDIKATLQTYKQMKEFCKCQEKIKV